MSEYILLLLMPVLVTAGQVLLKSGTRGVVTGSGFRRFILSCLNLRIAAAAFCTAAAPLLYIRALGKVPLFEAFAFNSLNYLLVFFAGRFFLGEKPDIFRSLGVILITAGFLLPFIAEAAGA